MFFSIFAIEFISRDKKHSCISAIIQVFLRIEQKSLDDIRWIEVKTDQFCDVHRFLPIPNLPWVHFVSLPGMTSPVGPRSSARKSCQPQKVP